MSQSNHAARTAELLAEMRALRERAVAIGAPLRAIAYLDMAIAETDKSLHRPSNGAHR